MRPRDSYWHKEAKRALKRLQLRHPHVRKIKTTEGRRRRQKRIWDEMWETIRITDLRKEHET
jgi:hypothetical protein